MMAEREVVHLETRKAWRDWLTEHGDDSPGVWLVSWRRSTGRPAVSYDESVEEALCFGWIDSTAKGIDDERTMLYFSPRKRGSGWSRSNKERLARLEADGLLTPRGLDVVARAKQDGSWALFDDVEQLIVPPDLAAALDERPPAREHWDAFSPSARRALLAWVVLARRAETRDKRVRAIAESAQRNERPDV